MTTSVRTQTPRQRPPRGAAPRLGALVEKALGGPLPVRLRAWDGSEYGPGGGPLVVLRSRRALRRLLWQPGELGLAEAYVTGEIDVEGDLAQGLRLMWRAAREGALHPPKLGLGERAGALASAARLGALGPRPPVPASRARLSGALHSTSRDRAAISHHYDLSNDFYRLLLDETMAYSCGYWAEGTADPDGDTADAGRLAQRAKLELICRKLDLRPGSRLLDIGCGWGSLTLYAAAEHGVKVTAVTLAAEQAAHVAAEVAARGLGELVDVECRHWRDITGGGYDAVATVEMGEHVGDAEYPHFTAALHGLVRPGGRVFVQQMSRGSVAPGGGAFIETYIAPDMHMRPLGETVGLLEGADLEVVSVQSLREHYVRTVGVWHRTLEERWAEFTALVGEETARVWRLYLVGGALAFAEGRMGVDQIVCVRRAADGGSGLPADPVRWYTVGTRDGSAAEGAV
ncbi:MULTISPECIES: SAM-dependent methyltransferase [Streptomyces]|uniref:Cyclopropane-fatty-acyl-phospholipid synthase n=1 Tax=Streptomyces albus (strain ATCC 21838 / DSM 41398 / FERM P-419 / JCM 4703 / NBRC 107858) TaxID=1081613 RepID=A0A0B5EWD1_STRA4|nr:cyclopropane-fatty-acyl-phospholipid synthase family protein [Streptomyces sp. SCSIO ZS0520]AJE83535.1 cyclopropane-fatty-acyl-phospholipid synthase [Streptomyces albus]AOU77843.1 cyclopropane-fatty-acyl-phospholipid synthase [Streptomyces albus]